MKAILNSLKPNMRRLLALSLACLTAASAMTVFTVPAAAAPVSDVKVWKWKRVNSKSDVKAILNGSFNDVTVPVYLCWETPNGESYVLQGMNGGLPNNLSDGFAYFYRNGTMNRYSSYNSEMPEDLASQFKKYLQEKYPDKVQQAGGIDYFFAFYGALYVDAFYKDVVKDSKAAWATSPAAKRFFADDGLCNRTSFLMMSSTGGFPKGIDTSSEKGLVYDSETFYTDTNASDVSMTVKSDLSVSFKCGNNSLIYQPGALNVQNELVTVFGSSLGWWDLDVSKLSEGVYFTLETSDTKNDRAQYTDVGKVQLVQTAQNRTCGLCFDGKYLDVLAQYDEKKPTYFSNFTLYYGVESTVTELEGDYTVKKGVTQNFNNNMIIGAGTHLVIEPGAVVTVTGLLQNKGTIENCGTLIVNENSAIVTTGEGTIKNYGNTADIPSMYYRAKVALATKEYEEKFEQLSKEWAYTYYNPMMAIEEDIELYGHLAEGLKDVPEAYTYYKKIYDEKCAEKQALLDKTAELREEYTYYQKNRDKIIRDTIASYYNEEMSKADATAEYEANLAELEKKMSEEYLKPRATLEQELEELKAAVGTETWKKMSAAERQKWQENYLSKQNELNAFIENTQDVVDEYNYYKDNRDKIIEEIFMAHGGGSEDSGETVTYTDCSGDLVVLHNGALFFDNGTAAPLSLYSGATYMNAGVAVLPRGFLVADAELQNTSTGHIFAGFYMADTTYNGTNVSSPGTKNATVANMKAADNGECVASGEYYLNNEGTIICHGGHVFADTLNKTSGLENMFIR